MNEERPNRIATQRSSLSAAIRVLEVVEQLGWSDVTLTCVPREGVHGCSYTYHVDATDLPAREAYDRTRSLRSTRTGT